MKDAEARIEGFKAYAEKRIKNFEDLAANWDPAKFQADLQFDVTSEVRQLSKAFEKRFLNQEQALKALEQGVTPLRVANLTKKEIEIARENSRQLSR